MLVILEGLLLFLLLPYCCHVITGHRCHNLHLFTPFDQKLPWLYHSWSFLSYTTHNLQMILLYPPAGMNLFLHPLVAKPDTLPYMTCLFCSLTFWHIPCHNTCLFCLFPQKLLWLSHLWLLLCHNTCLFNLFPQKLLWLCHLLHVLQWYNNATGSSKSILGLLLIIMQL